MAIGLVIEQFSPKTPIFGPFLRGFLTDWAPRPHTPATPLKLFPYTSNFISITSVKIWVTPHFLGQLTVWVGTFLLGIFIRIFAIACLSIPTYYLKNRAI